MNSLVSFFSKFGYLKYGIIVVMLMGMNSVAFGQVADPSGTPGRVYQSQEALASGPNSANETIEYVTETSTMRYFVFPNTVANPEYVQSSPFVFTDVLSTFNWSWGPTAATPFNAITAVPSTANASGTSPFVTTTFGELSDIPANNTNTLKVFEVPDPDEVSACGGEDLGSSFTVEVIQKPGILFDEDEYDGFEHNVCLTLEELESFTSITFPISVDWAYDAIGTITQAAIEVKFSVAYVDQYGNNPDDIHVDKVQLLTSASELVVPIDDADYGKYTITIHDVTDRISRKSFIAVPGVITSGADEFTWEVMQPVKTGPIYRVPNMNSITNVPTPDPDPEP